ncbi:MAG TPA: DUF2460 domain-containing protein [Novosphingobium sp.]|nr:DUF2460 domain-containing protein [Novosphingobium sp.]
MACWLASAIDGQETGWIQRFDPRFWTVNFPRPMMAALTNPAADAIRVDATFLTAADLAGLVWESADSLDHPLLAYATNSDYTGATLSFTWTSGGIIALDQVNGPTLTIEGLDASGAAHTWYVRLWNYASGTPTDAAISLPFSALVGGWATSGAGADPVWPAAISRMFISLAAPGYSGAATPLAAAVDGWAQLAGLRCAGAGAMLKIGNVFVPPGGGAIATSFDDQGNQSPARLVRGLRQLGYRGSVLHYVGMSHHTRLADVGGAYLVGQGGDPLNAPARAWHAEFFQRCGAAGLSPIASLSFEVLAQYCPAGWQQMDSAGNPALTAWEPPSTLLSPANAAAMGWLQQVAAAYAGLLQAAGVAVRVQIGEPWWWITASHGICLYDAAAAAALGGSPVAIADLTQPLTSAQTALLDAAGALLASATAGLVAAVRAAAGTAGAEVLLLVFTPTVLNPATPEAQRANLPLGWAAPAFDRLQVEDYDWLTAGADGLRRQAYQQVDSRLGYPVAQQDYLAGYVPDATQADLWRRVDAGMAEAFARGVHEVFVWALPQVVRDGFVHMASTEDEEDMQAFDDVVYPLPLGLDAHVSPAFSTTITTTASGFEHRASVWRDARLSFDVGPGVRSEGDLGTLIAFFRARRGAARGFRLADPSDFSSNGMTGVPGPADQALGTGDGATASFALVKAYGEAGCQQIRRITRPRAGTVRVSLGGVEQASGWTPGDGGMITFATAPAAGVAVAAGFCFDVPVRFEQDKLEVTGVTFAASEAPSVPVVEIREAV